MATVFARIPSTSSTPYSCKSTSSSLTSLSIAFSCPAGKRSPRLSAIQGEVEASTANADEDFVLQPRKTSENRHGRNLDQEHGAVKRGEPSKVQVIKLMGSSQESLQKLARGSRANIDDSGLGHILNDAYAKGDRAKASGVVELLGKSESGIIEPVKQSQALLGAVNREAVTCYLDSLLFAMFAMLDSYEAMLRQNFDDEPRKRLALLLRLWVNLLRTGKLITTDITRQLQLALAACGWKEAAESRQQDPSEAYSFITDRLALPMLTMKVNLFHNGKEDTDSDHKLVHERVIEVPVPDLPENQCTTFEDCLATYFNSQVEVQRYAQHRRNTINSIGSFQSDDRKAPVEVGIMSVGESQPSTPQAVVTPQDELFPTSPSRLGSTVLRKSSNLNKSLDPEKMELSGLTRTSTENVVPGRRRGDSLLKSEVKMQAFQIFSLILWHTSAEDANPTLNTNSQVVEHLKSKRPIVPIALKWSQMDSGRAVRRDTTIDIPLTCDIAQFITSDTDSADPSQDQFILVLQGFLCHRGLKPDSGHYVSAARCKYAKDGEYRWLLNDDLATPRVSYVEDIKMLLQKEKPYLLFYQVEPISALGEPPAYSDTITSVSSVLSASANFDDIHHSKSETNTGRTSIDGSVVDDTRGRSSTTSDRRRGLVRSSMPADDRKTNGTPKLMAEISLDSQDSGNVSLGDSKINQNASGGRQPVRSRDKRSSISLSRMTGRLTKGKSSTSLSGIEQTMEQNTDPTIDATERLETAKPGQKKSRQSRHGQHDEHDRKDCSLM